MLGFGLTVSAIGMGIVFFELTLLIFVIKLITFVAGIIENGKKNNMPGKKTETAVQTPAAAPVMVEAAENEDEIAAVIAAAVAYLTQGTTVITAIRRIHGMSGPIWSQAGRQETMSVRQ